jgi:hypothetical protein
MIGLSLNIIFGGVSQPCRGKYSCDVDFVIHWITSISLLILFAFVFDATMRCSDFVDRLSGHRTRWPGPALVEAARARNMDVLHLHDWLDIQLIAGRTKVVGTLLYFPFVALLILFVSRNRFFDNWDFPPSLIVMWTLIAAFPITSALVLHRVAERARKKTLERLSEWLVRVRGQGLKNQSEQIRLTIEEIKSLREGAFTSFAGQPVIAATLLVVLAVLQYYFTGP